MSVDADTTQIGHLKATSKIYTDASKPPIKITIFPGRPSGVQVVVSGRVPMFFDPYEGLTYQVNQVKPLTLTDAIHINGASVPVTPPEQLRLEKTIQTPLNSLIKDGIYQKILSRWPIDFGAVRESKCSGEIFGWAVKHTTNSRRDYGSSVKNVSGVG